LENLDDDDVDISRAWESIGENMETSTTESLGYYELKQRKPWCNDECSKLLDQGRQAKLQWLQNPSQIDGVNLKNVRRRINKTFMKKKKEISEIKN
jgi:hypothetical protein